MSHHPIQPLALDDHGVLRFKENAIVDRLLLVASDHGCDLNMIARLGFSDDDRQQFAQLIGYSLSGYGELSYVDDISYQTAAAIADDPAINQDKARIEALEEQLATMRKAIRETLAEPIAAMFEAHPDDVACLGERI